MNKNMEHLDSLMKENGFSENEKTFVRGVREEERAAALAQHQVLASLINSKTTQQLSNDLKFSISNLIINLSHNGESINRSLGDIQDSANSLTKILGNLNEGLSDFSESTTVLSKKANQLLFWYVLATVIIMVLTGINIYTQLISIT